MDGQTFGKCNCQALNIVCMICALLANKMWNVHMFVMVDVRNPCWFCFVEIFPFNFDPCLEWSFNV